MGEESAAVAARAYRGKGSAGMACPSDSVAAAPEEKSSVPPRVLPQPPRSSSRVAKADVTGSAPGPLSACYYCPRISVPGRV